jgi:oligopeptidase A
MGAMMNTPSTNPLLQDAPLPAFAHIQPEHVRPAVAKLLDDAATGLTMATDPATPADYEALERTLSVATERLGVAWGAVSHLNSVANTPELREAYNAVLPTVTEFFTALGADERLYAKYKAIAAQAEGLNAERQQALRHALRDFVLSGAELQGEARERFAEIQERSAELSQKFSEHVLDATDGFALYAGADELAGVPADLLAQTRDAAEKDGREGHKITLHFPVYFPVMQNAQNRSLRETLYRANSTRASDLGPAELDNSALMAELLALRQEEAKLLGHRHFASLSLSPKMATSAEQVSSFLQDLTHRARPWAEKDLAELRTFAEQELGIHPLEAWDVAFASERLKEARYAFNDQAVREYFTLPTVLRGLFGIIERVFGVTISADDAEVWHESVRFYKLQRHGNTVAQFYLDLYARPGKRPGAWMDEVRSRWLRPDTQSLQIPVAHLVCNFGAPLNGQPSLLTHDDVVTLFHEFGHGLHHMLTQVDDAAVAGLSGVEWDAVELPSQFMENFCWEWEVLQALTSHVRTGEPLPRELFDKMVAAKNFQAGLQMMRQMELSLFDLRLHAEPGSEGRIQALLDEVRQTTSVMPPPEFNRFQHSFSHIFAGGYAAGYYSYIWAEVLSADAWSAFEEEGIFNPATGERFRREILETGSTRDAMENFKAFRGREPTLDALLQHRGMN